jgi:hypothetical protein
MVTTDCQSLVCLEATPVTGTSARFVGQLNLRAKNGTKATFYLKFTARTEILLSSSYSCCNGFTDHKQNFPNVCVKGNIFKRQKFAIFNFSKFLFLLKEQTFLKGGSALFVK